MLPIIQSLPLAMIVFETIETILAFGSSSSVSSVSSDTIAAMPPSNLSCYVCSTIEDINCKYLNETLSRHGGGGDQALIALDNGAGDAYSSHRYILDNGQSLDPAYTSVTSQEDQPNNHNNRPSRLQPDLFNNFRSDCLPTEQYCIVLRLGVSALDNVQEFNFFALKRSCADQCQDGCFIIGNGERTKLSICATCCTTNYCNVGNFGTLPQRSNWIILLLMMIIALFCTAKIC